jgi:hypothetical protein
MLLCMPCYRLGNLAFIKGANALFCNSAQCHGCRLKTKYLTNGGKSIPKLVVRDVDGLDLFTWGPRPAPARQLVERLNDEGVDKSTVIVELQNWYNADKGGEMQEEWMRLFNGLFGLES